MLLLHSRINDVPTSHRHFAVSGENTIVKTEVNYSASVYAATAEAR